MSRNTGTGSIIGAGTTLATFNQSSMVYNGSTPVYTVTSPSLLAEMKDLKPPHVVVDKYEATGYDSPALAKEFLFGWKDGGEVDLDFNYLHATNVAIQSAIGVIQGFQITLPNSHTWTFLGAIVDWTGDLPNKGVCDIKLKVKITGLPLYA